MTAAANNWYINTNQQTRREYVMSTLLNSRPIKSDRPFEGKQTPLFSERLSYAKNQHEGSVLITRSDLSDYLGGGGLFRNTDDVTTDKIVGTRLVLMPGDVLYVKGSMCHYVYIIESGLLEFTHQLETDVGKIETVSYTGTGEWVGWPNRSERRQETVQAVARTCLLALPIDDLRALELSSLGLAELLARPGSLALKRNWRIAYYLRDLPAYTRTVVALTHLVDLACASRRADMVDTNIRVHLSVATLSRWIGLDVPSLMSVLLKLQRYGALVLKDDSIAQLMPQLLISTCDRSGLDASGCRKPVPQTH
ncbi:MAG: Crp/Fnr family transcriptional regulator [Aquabacterium sp.]|nr:Crp/Fnr family transcriptional regulator [Aquabacterium sp.]